MTERQYLGDDVYIEFDGDGFILSTTPESQENFIYVEPEVWENLKRAVVNYTEERAKDAETR